MVPSGSPAGVAPGGTSQRGASPSDSRSPTKLEPGTGSPNGIGVGPITRAMLMGSGTELDLGPNPAGRAYCPPFWT